MPRRSNYAHDNGANRSMTPVERQEAVLVAEEMICKRVGFRVIIQALRDQYEIKTETAKDIVLNAEKQMAAEVAERAPTRRAQLLASLDRLFERSVDAKRYQTALGISELIAKIEGHEKPRRMEVVPTMGEGFFDGRSESECEYFSLNGHFPDEAPVAPSDVTADEKTDFPLH